MLKDYFYPSDDGTAVFYAQQQVALYNEQHKHFTPSPGQMSPGIHTAILNAITGLDKTTSAKDIARRANEEYPGYTVDSFVRAMKEIANSGRTSTIREIAAFEYITTGHDMVPVRAIRHLEQSSFAVATRIPRKESQYADHSQFCDKLHARLERFLQQHAAR